MAQVLFFLSIIYRIMDICYIYSLGFYMNCKKYIIFYATY